MSNVHILCCVICRVDPSYMWGSHEHPSNRCDSDICGTTPTQRNFRRNLRSRDVSFVIRHRCHMWHSITNWESSMVMTSTKNAKTEYIRMGKVGPTGRKSHVTNRSLSLVNLYRLKSMPKFYYVVSSKIRSFKVPKLWKVPGSKIFQV